MRDACVYCGEPLQLAAEPRVGPAPRFVSRCADRCGGEALSGFDLSDPRAAWLFARWLPETCLWAFSRACL